MGVCASVALHTECDRETIERTSQPSPRTHLSRRKVCVCQYSNGIISDKQSRDAEEPGILSRQRISHRFTIMYWSHNP